MTQHRDCAKDLRHEQTEAETFVWSQLRSRRFSGFKFRRQVPLGNYIVDFVCLDRRVIVELDGGPHPRPLSRGERGDVEKSGERRSTAVPA